MWYEQPKFQIWLSAKAVVRFEITDTYFGFSVLIFNILYYNVDFPWRHPGIFRVAPGKAVNAAGEMLIETGLSPTIFETDALDAAILPDVRSIVSPIKWFLWLCQRLLPMLKSLP